MRLGFTGTQQGLRLRQLEKLRDALMQSLPLELHHGDCIGADAEAHELAMTFADKIVIHPPLRDAKRAFCDQGDNPNKNIVVLSPKGYIERNHDIVDMTEGLIACPSGKVEVLRSGTWATARYAIRTGKRVAVIFPDGSWRWGTDLNWRYL